MMNNLIYANTEHGIQVSGTRTVANMRIYNNTIVNNQDGSGIMIYKAMSSVDIANNILAGNNRFGIGTCDSSGCGVQLRNNLFYNNTLGRWDNNATFCSFNNIIFALSANIPADNNPGTPEQNPMFVNPASDWHLQMGSPAINMGTSLGIVTLDYDGVTRPQGGAYDMGAYEYH